MAEQADDIKRILIYADHREENSGIIAELRKRQDINVEIKQLDIGDFVLSNEVIVERKTIKDFLQSLIDGRLFAQLHALANSDYEKPLMIVEGFDEELYSLRNIHENAIKGAICSIALDYRIPIIFTRSTTETAQYLHIIAKREQIPNSREIGIRKGRKGFSTRELQQLILECLPNVGPTLAKKLLKHFGSVKKVMGASEKRLRKIDNIGEKKAKRIREVIDAEYADDNGTA